MAQSKRKAVDQLVPEDKEKKDKPSFRRPLSLKIADDDGVELQQMHIEYLYDNKTPGCINVSTSWVFAGEVFPFLYEAIGHIIASRSVCGIIAGYCSSHENTGQQVWIHSRYRRGNKRQGYPEDAIAVYDSIDERAWCRITDPVTVCRGNCKCKTSKNCREDLFYVYRDMAYGYCYDARVVGVACYRCSHIVYSCEYVVPCLPYL